MALSHFASGEAPVAESPTGVPVRMQPSGGQVTAGSELRTPGSHVGGC
jgi:hypothetical protein